jgi:hypothetical protein
MQDPTSLATPWWEDDNEESCGRQLNGLVSTLWERDADRRGEIEENYRRFSGPSVRTVGAMAAPAPEAIVARKRPLRLNLVKSVVETITAKVGKNRPRPTLLTDGGNHELQMRIRDLQKFVDGAYQQAEVYNLIPGVFRDAMIAGTGLLHFYGRRQADSGRICAERMLPTELLVDARDAINGDPQSAYRVKFMDRWMLSKLFPKSKLEIMSARTIALDELPDYERSDAAYSSNLVRVVEAWHLATYDYEGELVPGRRVIIVDNHVLCSEEWAFDYFPFERYHWTAPTTGYWGESAVGEVIPIDSEVNTLLQQIQAAMRLTANPWVLISKGSKVKATKLTNKIGQLVEYDGPTPPSVVSHQPIHPQVIQHLWGLFAKAYEILGSNEMAASAVKPPGVDSGRALEQLSEEHLVRFETQSRHLEDVIGVKCCRQVLRVAKELNDSIPGGFVLRSTVGKTALKLPWDKVEMSPHDFFAQCFPTSILPHLPAGRTEEVERWQANQWIDAAQAQKLLDFPDLDTDANLMLADEHLLDSQISEMLYGDGDNDELVLPDPRQNLEKAATRVTYAYLEGLHKGVPEARLRKLRRYLDAIDEINQAAAPPPPPEAMLGAGPVGDTAMGPGAMPPAGAPPMMPPGMPMPGAM